MSLQTPTRLPSAAYYKSFKSSLDKNDLCLLLFCFCALVTSESDLHNIWLCSWRSEHGLICFITDAKFPSNHEIRKIKHNGCAVKGLSLHAKERHNVHKSSALFGRSALIHSSHIPPHIWQWRYVTRAYSYHFLSVESLTCHTGISSCCSCTTSQH